MSTIKPEQVSLLFTIIAFLKCKFVLHLLKEDGRNRSVSVYNNIIKFFSTYYKIPVYTVEVAVSNQTELEAEGRAVEQLFSDNVFQKVFSKSKHFLYLIFISSTYCA